jgi:hypothetical protein
MTGATVTILTVLIMLGATMRLTRLIVSDTITAGLRARIMRHGGPDAWPYLWVSCPWCVGLWLAFAVTIAVYAGAHLSGVDLLPVPGWLWVPGLALANNYVTARLYE